MKSKANVMILKMDSQGEAKLDWLKWLVASALILAGLIGNHYYGDVSMPIRTVAWLAVLAIAGFIASKTQKGRWVVEFFGDSRAELRKVTWPTRELTIQTALIVAVMVIVLALILWGVDGILVWLIGTLTGQKS